MGRALKTFTWNEPTAVSDVVKSEEEGHYCRDVGTLKSGFGTIDIGMVLGKISTGSATSAAKSGGNTGTGTNTLDVTTPVVDGAKIGIYTLRCVTAKVATVHDGIFELKDPDGNVIDILQIPTGNGSIAYNNDIKGVLAGTSTAFVVGDGFDITVAGGSGKFAPYDPTALNGSQRAVAILLHKSDTTADVPSSVFLVRGPAQVSVAGLKWGANVTTQGQKDAAIAALTALGMVVRASA